LRLGFLLGFFDFTLMFVSGLLKGQSLPTWLSASVGGFCLFFVLGFLLDKLWQLFSRQERKEMIPPSSHIIDFRMGPELPGFLQKQEKGN